MLQFIRGMIKSFIFLIAFQASSIFANIIYVYLAPQLPSYIYIALEQARLFNPKTNIFLIANEAALHQCQEMLNAQNIIAVPAEKLQPSMHHQQFNATSTLDTESYGGLWRKSTERFFYMQELIALYNLKSVIHVEADVMLYFDISEFKDVFDRYAGIGAVFDCDVRCIPSVIYISNERAINHLAAFIAEKASRGLFDMQMLGAYRNRYSAEYVDNLPLIMPEYLQCHAFMNGTSRPQSYFNNIERFQSIFDAAAIGQYLGGVSPVHGPPQPGFINETCIFNPSHLRFEWHKDAQGRNTPFAVCNGKKYRINNLHIHSKSLEKFKS